MAAKKKQHEHTHDTLCALAANWARSRRYPMVLCDVRSWATSEQPDVIAWKNSGASLVLEVKTSRADFKHDAEKSFRRDAERGMGYARCFVVPAGLVSVDELPKGWGLIEARGPRLVVVKKSAPFTLHNVRAERDLLVMALRRATEGWGRQIFGVNVPLAPDGDPHPKAARIIREQRAEIFELRRRLKLASESAHAEHMLRDVRSI